MRLGSAMAARATIASLTSATRSTLAEIPGKRLRFESRHRQQLLDQPRCAGHPRLQIGQGHPALRASGARSARSTCKASAASGVRSSCAASEVNRRCAPKSASSRRASSALRLAASGFSSPGQLPLPSAATTHRAGAWQRRARAHRAAADLGPPHTRSAPRATE